MSLRISSQTIFDVGVKQIGSINSSILHTQLATNRKTANSSLSQEDVALASSMTIIQNVMTLATNAGDGSLSQADRGSLATELQGQLNDLLGQANTADGAGGYLFSGYKS